MSAERPISVDHASLGSGDGLRIRELRESPRRPGRYLLQLSDGRTLVLGVGVLADCGATRVGQQLTVETVARLVHESAVTAMADRALDMLARGRRTRRELERRLLRPPVRRGRSAAPSTEAGGRSARQHDEALDSAADRSAKVREALDRLEASGLLNDADVAEAEAAARLRRGEAPGRVTQVLRRKGVAGRVVDAAVQEAMAEDHFDERAACLTVAEKRARALRALAPDVAQRRLLGFLQRRGYSGAVARDVTREVLASWGASSTEWEGDDESRLADETLD